MLGSRSDLQVATQISNDLHRLLKIGVLYFYGAPASGFSLANASTGDWCWLDADFISSVYGGAAHPALRALAHLVNCRFLAATYRPTYVSGASSQLTVWKVRVFGIPSDIDGSRFLRSWRRSKFRNPANLGKAIKKNMNVLLCYLDFSRQSWSATFFSKSLTPLDVLMIPFTGPDAPDTSALHHHMQRWVNCQSYSAGRALASDLDDVLQSVYKKIETPNLSAFFSNFNDVDALSPEQIIHNLMTSTDQSVLLRSGLTTELYRFQLESLCKMYEKESFTSRDHVSNFVKITSPTNQTYYYDTVNGDLFLEPELMTIPRGGILAENMGLGKTLVCLALVCLTKCENSTIPNNVLLYDVNESVQCGRPRSLFDIARRTVVENLSWKHYVSDLSPHIAAQLRDSPATFTVFEHTQQERPRAGRQVKSPSRTLNLCSTTLIVVPENIIHQWIGEIEKHLSDLALKKLFIHDNTSRAETPFTMYMNSIPANIQDLISYDLILISSSQFSKLSSDSNNVLMNIYWKRLIIDEGHSLNSRASNLSLLCKSLYAERRWAVSGTPTSGLTDLQMEDDTSQNSDQMRDVGSTVTSPKRKKRKYVVKSKFNSKEDLRKLGNLVTSYFKFEPFASQPALWNKTIVKDLLSPNQFAAQHSLQKILNILMVRHSQTQVEKDIKLPPLHHEAIFITPSYHNKLAINLFTSVLAVNAVTSERVGSDYMFDASNRKQLRTLVNNLQLSTFYWTGFKAKDVKSLLNVAMEYLSRKSDEGVFHVQGKDRLLLQESVKVAEIALKNPRWRMAATIHEMQYLVINLPHQFVENYAIESLSGEGVYGGPQLVAAQRFFYKNRFKDLPGLSESLAEDSSQFWKQYWQDFEKKNSDKLLKRGVADTTRVSGGNEDQSESVEILKSRTRNFHSDLNSHDGDIRKAQVLGTASAKLSYLVCKLFDGQVSGTKSLVFFDFEDHAYFLTEALDILGMNYLLYATFIGSKTRAENLDAFSSRESRPNQGICLIMDIKLASHGLNITAATKVYFINPVWQRSVEAQAIKRAHRISQTREVHVETLILKGTLEEEIYRKRQTDISANNPGADPENKHVIDDAGIQSYVLKHDFLSFEAKEDEYCPLVVLDDHVNQGPSVPAPDRDDGFALPQHSRESVISGASRISRWKMHLFTPENLQKMSEIDAKKNARSSH